MVVSVADTQAGAMEIADQISAIVCGAKQLLENGAGYFRDLATLLIKKPDWTSPEMMQAMAGHVSWAVLWADNMGLSPLEAATLAFWSFILASKVIRDKVSLTNINWISGKDLKENVAESALPSVISSGPTLTVTATASVTSSSVLECSASCTHVGVIRDCETWCATPTGDQFNYDRPSASTVQAVAFEPWRVPKQIPIERPVVQAPLAICPPPPGNATDFPTDLFGSVYTKFCKDLGVYNTENATTTVNWKGDRHLSLKSRLLRFMLRDDGSNDAKYKDYKFMLGRYIRDGVTSRCSVSCEMAFQQFSSQDLCKRGDDKNTMASNGILDAGCALYSFSIEVPQPKVELTCKDQNGDYSASKYDRSASGATGIESAIKNWCSDNGLKQLTKGGPTPYGRWPITQINVPNRSSFWPRAQVHGNNNVGIILCDQCISAFTEGLKRCEPDSDMTHGFNALVGSLEYSIDVSGWTQEGNPPWDQKVSFPPADNLRRPNGDPYASECFPNSSPGEHIDVSDFEKAIDGYCQNGVDLQAPDSSWNDGPYVYPPHSQPAFYVSSPNLPDERLHLSAKRMDVSLYADPDACKGYDYKMGRDDCIYVMRRIYRKCNKDSLRWVSMEMKYRCVWYKAWVLNTNKS